MITNHDNNKQNINTQPLFDSFPTEILEHIFSFLSSEDLRAKAQTSSTMNVFCNDDRQWKALLKNDFNFDYSEFSRGIQNDLIAQPQPISPKLVYRTLRLLKLFGDHFSDATLRLLRKKLHPGTETQDSNPPLRSVTQQQSYLLQRGYNEPDVAKFETLTRNIQQLSLERVELAYLLLNSGLDKNDVRTISTLKPHLAQFKKLDLSMMDNPNLLIQQINTLSNLNYLILPSIFLLNNKLIKTINKFPNLVNLTIICGSEDSYKLHSNDPKEVNFWIIVLKNTSVKSINVQLQDTKYQTTFQRPPLQASNQQRLTR